MKKIKLESENRQYERAGLIRLTILLFFSFLFFYSCTTSNTPHKKLVGHWKQVSFQTKADNAAYKSEQSGFTPTDLYFSRNTFWRVEQGVEPVQLLYEVIEENIEDTSLIICVNIAKGELYSNVRFSSDFKEMKFIRQQDPGEGNPPEIARIIRAQMGMITIETGFIRVDNKTMP